MEIIGCPRNRGGQAIGVACAILRHKPEVRSFRVHRKPPITIRSIRCPFAYINELRPIARPGSTGACARPICRSIPEHKAPWGIEDQVGRASAWLNDRKTQQSRQVCRHHEGGTVTKPGVVEVRKRDWQVSLITGPIRLVMKRPGSDWLIGGWPRKPRRQLRGCSDGKKQTARYNNCSNPKNCPCCIHIRSQSSFFSHVTSLCQIAPYCGVFPCRKNLL